MKDTAPGGYRRLAGRLARDPAAVMIRARRGGVVTALRATMAIPSIARRPVARSAGVVARALARRWPESSAYPVAVFIAYRAAGSRSRAAAWARDVGTAARTSALARRRLASLAVASGLAREAAEIAAAAAADDAPVFEGIRAKTAFTEGRYRDSLAHARLAHRGGVAGARALAARVQAELAVLEPGWMPAIDALDPAPARSRPPAHAGRVLHVVSVALPDRLAGYTVRTQAVARCQREAGLDPHVLVRSGFPPSSAGQANLIDGVTYHLVPPDVASSEPDRVISGVARAAVPLLRTLRPAVVQPASDHLQASLGLALGRVAGVPVVYEVRGFWEASWAAGAAAGEASAVTTDRYRLTRAAETAAMRAADAVVTLSETMRAEVIARGCEPGRVVVVPNAVDVDAFRPGPRDERLAASLGIPRGAPVVGYVTTLWPFEGIPTLLEAAVLLRRRHPDLRVLLVGDGKDRPRIEAMAHELRLDDGCLVMPGRIPHDEIAAYYGLLDAFVVPRDASRVANLVTPLKPFEAMALERAVVVSDLPALLEIVRPGETGLAFRAGSASDLADVLGQLLADPDLRTRLGARARAWVAAERTWTANGRRYRDLFERLGAA